MKNKVVVLGANYYIGLSIIRCLGREGIHVAAVDYSEKGTYGFYSKYLAEKLIAPHYKKEEKAFVSFLINYARKQEAKPVLFPTADPYVEVIDKHLDELKEYYLINQTEQGLFTRLMEKDSLAEVAEAYGVKIPETVQGNHPNVIEEVEREIGYPCLIKPADSPSFVALFRKKVFQAENRSELIQVLAQVKSAQLDVIIQRIIPGFDDHMYTFDAYLNQESKVTHWMTAQKYRQYPINFGASVYTAQKYVPELYDIGAPFLEGVGYKGFAEIEFKGESPVPMMVETARTIEQAGADLIVIPCVTAHYFYNQFQDHVEIPIVNVFDVLTHFLQQHYPDVQTVGVLCTTGTKTTNLFGKKLTDYEIVYPDNRSQEQEVMAAIYGEEGIKQGNMGEYPRVLLKSAAEKLAAKGCDILICGCTEVELALKQEDVGRPLIDPMDVMAGYVTHNR